MQPRSFSSSISVTKLAPGRVSQGAVSVLSPAKPLRFGDENELLAQLHMGEDGVILEHEGRRATFLPQVWESLPDKRNFLGELMRKADIPAETRLARCQLWRYRVIKWKQGAPH